VAKKPPIPLSICWSHREASWLVASPDDCGQGTLLQGELAPKDLQCLCIQNMWRQPRSRGENMEKLELAMLPGNLGTHRCFSAIWIYLSEIKGGKKRAVIERSDRNGIELVATLRTMLYPLVMAGSSSKSSS
jgi:hypothetical protein